jgi:hypothetical protein
VFDSSFSKARNSLKIRRGKSEMILDTVLRMETSIDELKNMMVSACLCLLSVILSLKTNFRLSMPEDPTE